MSGSTDGSRLRCSAVAAGPCARCHQPVCGDCCVLTEGGARVWAVCFGCADRAGTSLRSGWWRVIGWIAGPILVLTVIVVFLTWVTSK